MKLLTFPGKNKGLNIRILDLPARVCLWAAIKSGEGGGGSEAGFQLAGVDKIHDLFQIAVDRDKG